MSRIKIQKIAIIDCNRCPFSNFIRGSITRISCQFYKKASFISHSDLDKFIKPEWCKLYQLHYYEKI